MMVIGLLIIILSFGLSQIIKGYSVWIMAIGFTIGAIVIFKGREKIGLKNNYFGDE
jgi:hypothetical protein